MKQWTVIWMMIRTKFSCVNVRLLLYAIFVFPGLAFSSQAADTTLELRAEQWELARQGENLIRLPVLNDVVNRWSANRSQGQSIELHYPGGEEGELWVRELIHWLISLGIPSQYLVALPGSGDEDIIRFRIIKNGRDYR